MLGLLEGAEGLEAVEEAVELASRAPVRLELAKSLAALGITRRRAGRPDYAREPLARAYELAQVCGAERLLESIRTEMLAVGADPGAAVPRGVKALTATEKRVATLAAAGRAEREIAQELFVTPRVIELKLGSARRKLGATTQGELALALEMNSPEVRACEDEGETAIIRQPGGKAHEGPCAAMTIIDPARDLCGGAIALPGDDGYDAARQIFNLARRPASRGRRLPQRRARRSPTLFAGPARAACA